MPTPIHDPEIAYSVTDDGEAVHLTMRFQDAARPETAARVGLEMGGIEALKLATELVAAARRLHFDTVTFAEALLQAQKEPLW